MRKEDLLRSALIGAAVGVAGLIAMMVLKVHADLAPVVIGVAASIAALSLRNRARA